MKTRSPSLKLVASVAAILLFAGSARAADPSTRPGMGAIPYATGTTFRVWAPNAASVAVVGDFNGFDPTANPLAAEGNGNFSADVDGAFPGNTYQFVIQHGQATLQKTDPRARQVVSSSGAGVIVDPSAFAWTSAFRAAPFNEEVVYEMHVGSFNATTPGRPGTWTTAMDKLDDLAAIGVNMLEVLPPAEFAGDFSWGYNPAFPFAPESAYGTPDDMRSFIDAAHARGMGVIIDVVHNHYGPSDLSMWDFDGESYGPGNGGIYFYTDWRRESGWGPRPDFGRAQVRDYIDDNTRMWLFEYKADGLRWDSTVNIRSANGSNIPEGWGVLQRVNDTKNAAQPWKIMIAEDLQGNDWITKKTGAGGAGFDSQWDAGFFHPVDDAIIAQNDSDRSMFAVRDAITHTYNGSATQRVIYTESHDEVANGKKRINNTRGLRGNHVNVFHVNDRDKLVAFHRWDRGGAGDDVVVLANFSNQAFPGYEIGFPRGGTWHVRLNSDSTDYSPDFQNTPSVDVQASRGGRDGLGYRGTVGVGPYSVVILSQ